MSHRCFVSFKKENSGYKNAIVKRLGELSIPVNVLDKTIQSDDIDYVIQRIRDEYMNNTTVTLFLIGSHSSENEGVDSNGYNHQSFIIRELRATLYDKTGNPRDGLLGIVLPEMYNSVFGGRYECPHCHDIVSYVNIDPSTVIKEFCENYYLHEGECGHYDESGRFCVLVKYDDFMKEPESYIDKAYNKTKEPIAEEVHFRDISHAGKY